jgi:hypothetical protein
MVIVSMDIIIMNMIMIIDVIMMSVMIMITMKVEAEMEMRIEMRMEMQMKMKIIIPPLLLTTLKNDYPSFIIILLLNQLMIDGIVLIAGNDKINTCYTYI